MNKQLLLILTILVLLLTACGGRSDDLGPIIEDIATIEAEVGTITRVDCPLKITGEEEGQTYYCGVYTAPLDYSNPSGKTLNLTFVVLRAEIANPLPDPIVFLAGGPGQSGVVSAGGTLYGDLRQERDLVFPAQRGTLFSNRLALDECVALLGEQMGKSELETFVESVAENEDLDRSLPYDEYLKQYSERAGAINARCYAAFTDTGLDPAQFTTANSTDDLVGLMTALGYDSFNLHGVSYGTRLALETLRRHPEANIHSVVLDSPVAPSIDRLAVEASAFHDNLMRLFEVCTADTDCNAAYPKLTERTNALLNQLADQPVAAGDQLIGPDELVTQLSDLTNTRANYIPRMIAELELGDATTYLALLNGEVGTQSPEGSATSPGVDQLISQVSGAASDANPEDLMGNLQVVADILKAAQEEQPKEAMKAAAQDKLADSNDLPEILETIDSLTPEELDEIVGLTAGTGQRVDKDEVAKATEAQEKNNALFMLAGMVCSEQLPFEDVATALEVNNNLEIPALRVSESFLATEVGNCSNYPMGELDPSYHAPVTSDIPTLILQGEFDVRTPLVNGLTLAEQLENATLVVVPQAGHETWTAGGCVAQMGTSFFKNPNQALDTSCLDVRQEHFALPGEASSEQVSP